MMIDSLLLGHRGRRGGDVFEIAAFSEQVPHLFPLRFQIRLVLQRNRRKQRHSPGHGNPVPSQTVILGRVVRHQPNASHA